MEDVLETLVRLKDGGDVGDEIRSGEIGGFGRGGKRVEFGERDGGGGGPPADPRGAVWVVAVHSGLAEVRIIEDGGEALGAPIGDRSAEGGVGTRRRGGPSQLHECFQRWKHHHRGQPRSITQCD